MSGLLTFGLGGVPTPAPPVPVTTPCGPSPPTWLLLRRRDRHPVVLLSSPATTPCGPSLSTWILLRRRARTAVAVPATTPCGPSLATWFLLRRRGRIPSLPVVTTAPGPPVTTELLLRRRRAVRPTRPVVYSWDPDFLAQLKDRVAVEIDMNAAGLAVPVYGPVTDRWQPVAGLESLRCWLADRQADPTETNGRPGALRGWRVLFGQSVNLNRKHRLVYQDPDRDAPSYLYIQGSTRNAAQLGIYWVCDAVEHVE